MRRREPGPIADTEREDAARRADQARTWAAEDAARGGDWEDFDWPTGPHPDRALQDETRDGSRRWV